MKRLTCIGLSMVGLLCMLEAATVPRALGTHLNFSHGDFSLQSITTGEANTAIGDRALRETTEGDRNTAVGTRALQENVDGSLNTAVGAHALQENVFGGSNTAVGFSALRSNHDGGHNVAVGRNALRSNLTGFHNIAVGGAALLHNEWGHDNLAIGRGALLQNTGGRGNVAIGTMALRFLDTSFFFEFGEGMSWTGHRNTAVGDHTLWVLKSGSHNIALGAGAGGDLDSGSQNIYLGHSGLSQENGTIRLGHLANHHRTFVAGIHGTPLGGDAVTVQVNLQGQLGVAASSRRYKTDIHDMGEKSKGLLQLRPVTFRYKEPVNQSARPLDYGLIAEEVAEVYPELVTHNPDGQVEAVQYDKLITMLLNELQNQHRQNTAQTKEISDLRSELMVVKTHYQNIQNVKVRLAKLEAQLNEQPTLTVQAE